MGQYTNSRLHNLREAYYKPTDDIVTLLQTLKLYKPNVNNAPLPCLKILVINFRSLLPKKEILEALLENTKPDVVLGTETWLIPDTANSEFISDDYKVHRRDRLERKNRKKDGAGGVLIAIKSEIISEKMSYQCDTESVYCRIKQENRPPLIIGAVYRPPDNDVNYSVKLCESIRTRFSENKTATFIIGGDLNLPDIDWKGEKTCGNQYVCAINEQFLNTSLDLNLRQTNFMKTRGKNVLELLFTSHPNLVEETEVIPGLSDHEILQTKFAANPPRNKQKKREILLWKKADTENMKREIRTFSEEFLKNHNAEDDIDLMWQRVKNKLLNIVKENVPTKTTSSRQSKAWINSDVKKILTKKKRLFDKFKSCPSEKTEAEYREVKKEAQKQCRKAFAEYLNGEFLEEGCGNKKFWSFIKSRTNEHVGIADLMDRNGNPVEDAEAKANLLNAQFSSVFSDPSGTFSGNMGDTNVDALGSIEVTEVGVLKLLKSVKVNKATGPDDISARILHTFAEEICALYTFLFQVSLRQGKIPEDWKKAHITPIFKKGDKSKAENYRPVSITSISCKLLEHIICSNIMSHLEKWEVLTDVQHGFRRLRSCETQLITTCADFIDTLNRHGQTDAILLDFSKAFDKVHHQSLLNKLKHYGIDGNVLQWISSFLSGRTQKVVVDNKKSYPLPVLSGVPQGTVIGPLLFLVYINDMPERISEGTKLRLFADDSLLYRTISNVDDTKTLQKDLDRLQDWEEEWRMEFHPKKCKVLSITNKIKPLAATYSIHGEQLENVSEAEYLGVTIDSKMKWNSHVDKICSRANKKLGFLRRNISSCPTHIKENAYKTLVRPMLDYCSSVWDPHTQRNINKIEGIQRRAARFVYNKHKYSKEVSITKLLQQHNWVPLRERRAKHKATLLCKARLGLSKIPIDGLKKNERKKDAYVLPASTIDAHLYSFHSSAVRLWNSLPDDTKGCGDADKFTRSLQNVNLRLL